MNQHERVVIDVDDAAFSGGCLSYLVGVVHGRQPGTDIQQLADPSRSDYVLDGSYQKPAVSAGSVVQIRVDEQNFLTDFAIDRVVVFTTQ